MYDERPDDDEEEEDIGPGEADYDLSEEHGYMWEPARPGWPPRWLIIAVTFVVVASLVLPAVLLIINRG